MPVFEKVQESLHGVIVDHRTIGLVKVQRDVLAGFAKNVQRIFDRPGTFWAKRRTVGRNILLADLAKLQRTVEGREGFFTLKAYRGKD